MMSILASTLTLVSAATAQQVLYGQCGGKGWTGQTTCASGLTCQVQNEWYSQCLPGTAAPTTSQAAPTTIITSTKTASSSPPVSTNVGGTFPSASGTRFTIDGVTKYFAGTNCYWCSVNGLSNADVDLALDHIQSSGLKILRVWGFNDVNSIPSSGVWFQYLSSSGSTINTGANGLQRLDYVVQAAEKRGIKLIIPFVNNWGDYGGYQAYVNAFGGSTTSWYTNSAAQTQYKKYIQAVVSRYTGSTAILAWELANEPRCSGCNTDVIYNWAKSTSAYIKSLDRNHMVALGDEGFGLSGDSSYPYGYSEGSDFAKNLQIPDLDFGTFHMYPVHWSVSNDWGNKWINDHAAACRNAGKPCFLEEYGANGDHCSIQSPWQRTSVAASGMAGDAFWQHGDKLSIGNSHDDGFTIYYNTPDWTCLVTDHVKAIG